MNEAVKRSISLVPFGAAILLLSLGIARDANAGGSEQQVVTSARTMRWASRTSLRQFVC
jgi:hypothetical protein